MRKITSALLTSGIIFAQSSLFAQQGEVEELEEFTIEETVEDPVGIIPERPTETLFGTARTVLEIPRSVSMIEGAMLERYGVHSVADFISVAAGTFTDNFFGIPGSLQIRGTFSDTFFRGFRRVENRGNFPTPITATQRVEIVRGPPTPYYGGGKIGGFMNFIPKSARTETAKFIEKPTGKVVLTYGTYDRKQLDLEYGAPVETETLNGGYYLYGQFEDSNSFYHNVVNRSKILQASFDVDLNEVWNVEFGGMWTWSRLIQNPGWNRLTPELISNGTYITGQPATLIPDTNGNGVLDEEEAIPFNLDTFCLNLDLCFDFDGTTGLTNIGTSTLSRRQGFTDPNDFGDTTTYVAYFDLNAQLSDNLRMSTQLFYDHMQHDKHTTYGFTSVYNPTVVEIKHTIFHKGGSSDSLSAESVVGINYRTYETNHKECFSNDMQIFDRRDLSVGPTAQDRFAACTTPGRMYNDHFDSTTKDLGVFGLTDLTLANEFGIIAGFRWDFYDQSSTLLAERAHALADPNADFGKTAVDEQDVLTFNLSGTWERQINDAWTVIPYITYAESTFIENSQSGGVSFGATRDASWLSDSDLWEGGLKLSGLEKKLQATFALYQQNRTFLDTMAEPPAVINTRSTGYELEARLVPTRNWAFSLTGTWSKTIVTPPPGFGSFTVLPIAVVSRTPEQAYGGRYFSGSGFLGLESFEQDGQPDKVISAYASYTGEWGEGEWGFTFGSTYVADVFSGRVKYIKLPDYWLTNLSGYYQRGKWRFGGLIKNVFDTRYFRSQNIFHEVLVLPGEGVTGEVTLSYIF